MKRYEKYKPSGVEWLGEVPEEWIISPLKFYFDVQLGKMLQPKQENSDDIEINYIKAINVQWKEVNTENLSQMWCSPKDIEKYEVKNGDLLVCEGGEVGRCSIVNNLKELTIIQNAVHRIRPNENSNTLFLNYFIQHIANSSWFNILCNKATIAHLTSEKLLNTIIALPSLAEQVSIANFLDKKTEKIDRLISHQQALLEKLSEKRTALITEAVCGRVRLPTALNDNETLSGSNAPLRNSGIEWLGEVPEHWETWKITHLINLIGSGTTPKSDNLDYYDGNTLWVTTSELRENYISDTKQKISQEALNDHSALKIYPPNSVAIAMYGATIGRLGILEKEATFNQACCIFSPSKKLHHKFLFYWLWHRRPILISLSNGGGQPNLSQDDLKKIKLAIPSYEEQTAIVNYLDTETAKIDRLQHKIERVIERLKEYRSALITQVVTGKVKV